MVEYRNGIVTCTHVHVYHAWHTQQTHTDIHTHAHATCTYTRIHTVCLCVLHIQHMRNVHDMQPAAVDIITIALVLTH